MASSNTGSKTAESAVPFLSLDAPAKVNLYLGVHTDLDERGYHLVDSVMVRLGLADRVSFFPSEKLEVTCDPVIDLSPEKNTAYRAAEAMSAAFGKRVSYRIHIEKRIPVRSGLGGPSTDAASVIRGLCMLWGIDPRAPRVVEIARAIGSDVPFFLFDGPAYLDACGDTMREEFSLPACMAEVPVVLVRPDCDGVSTPEAYRRFDVEPCPCGDLPGLLEAVRSLGKDASGADNGEGPGGIEGFRNMASRISNNLAPVACEIVPAIGETLDRLRSCDGVLAAEVCGSGACTFAICDDPATAEAIAREEALRGSWTCVTHFAE